MNYEYTKIFKEIDKFLSSNLHNMWVDDGVIFIYVRKSKRYVEKSTIDFFDIANVTVNEAYQNKGVFTNFIKEFILRYPTKNIYVESILNPILFTLLKKFDFKTIESSGADINMYLIK